MHETDMPSPAPSSAEAYSKAIDGHRGGGNSSIQSPGRAIGLGSPMRAECVKSELDSAEIALEEVWRMFEQLAMHVVGIPPEPNKSSWPSGDSIADRSTRIKLRSQDLMPVMNVLLQRLA